MGKKKILIIIVTCIIVFILGYGTCYLVNKEKIEAYENDVLEKEDEAYENEYYDEEDYESTMDEETELEELVNIKYNEVSYVFYEFEYENTEGTDSEITNYEEVMNNVFTENGKKIFEEENKGLINIKDGKAYISSKDENDENTEEYILDIQFADISEQDDTITTTVVRKMSKIPVVEIEDEENAETYELKDEMILKKIGTEWLVDKYSYVIK